MNLHADTTHPLYEDLASPLASPSSSLMQILRISQLQACISQARAKLTQLSRDTETARRRVKAQSLLHRNAGCAAYTQAEVSELMTLIVLLEEENCQLRALSAIPVEIEKLKAELQDTTKPDVRSIYESSLKDLQTANSRLKEDLATATNQLKSAEFKLHHTVEPALTAPLSLQLREPPFIEVETSSHWAKPLSPASPASRLIAKPLFKAKTSPKRTVAKSANKPKARGYSPTFMRLMRGSGRKKLESTSPIRYQAEDAFADVFPEEVEGRAQESHR